MELDQRESLLIGDTVLYVGNGANESFIVSGISTSKTHFWVKAPLDYNSKASQLVNLADRCWVLPKRRQS
jgi:hypothetical protein